MLSGGGIARLAVEFATSAAEKAAPFLAWFAYCWARGVKARWRDALAFETIFREM